MNKINQINELDICILCGGLGSRLRSVVSERQKVLADINKRPFINILIDQLYKYQIKKIILCSGYLKEQIKNHFDNNEIDIILSEEEEPLGTGGAILNALINKKINSKTFMVLNGDSICDIDYQEFLNFHIIKKGLLSIVLTNTNESKDYGVVSIDNNNKIINFNEKCESKNRFINAGIYLMDIDIYHHMLNMSKKFSLEYELFPSIVKQENCYGFVTDKELLDIGTPDRYNSAYETLKNIGILK